MEGENLSKDLRSILEAIRSADVVETRVQLLDKLLDFKFEKSDLVSLGGFLTEFWEDFTCLDVTQCLLNRTILNVTSKCIEADISDCLVQFLTLGIKASMWCEKHLQMTIMSTQESQEEEHSNLFFQMLLDMLKFSAASFSALARYPVSEDLAAVNLVENFILEQLKLMKDVIAEIKKIQSCGPELLKASQITIEAVIKLCGVYFETLTLESGGDKTQRHGRIMVCEEPHYANHVVNIFKYTIERLCELGIIAANGGGSLVTILNVSWKGVVTLLQYRANVLEKNVNVAHILLTLVLLVIEPLRCAAEAWSSPMKETVSVTEARRTFVPVKFYLIHAVKIVSMYPCQAHLIYKDIILCVLKVYTYKISMSNQACLRIATEVMSELLEETSLDLLKALLNSSDIQQDLKVDILDTLFTYESYLNSTNGDASHREILLSDILSTKCESMIGSRVFLLGRVSLFLNFLRYSHDIDEDMKHLITKKLQWFLDVVVDENVYTSILSHQIPVLNGSGKTAELVWETLFCSILCALKSFTIVVSSTLAWEQLKAFLLENFFHQHFLCWEIVMDLWCFILRHADISLANNVIHHLYSLMKLFSSSKAVLAPDSALRKVARSICTLLTYGAKSLVNEFCAFHLAGEKFQNSSAICAALFLEGFPLNLLSDKLKTTVTEQILNEYFSFIENFNDSTMVVDGSLISGFPILALSALLHSLKLVISDTNARTLKFILVLICNYKMSANQEVKDQCCKLLSETLVIVSHMDHLYSSNEMENVILELKMLFVSGTTASDSCLKLCIPGLAVFMAGLSRMKLVESDDDAKFSAVWELYHMLLAERNWILIHLALTAFGYFAARTSCNELWRFVPQNAALSYNLETGNKINDGFMGEFKVFLEKEMALLSVAPSPEQLEQIGREGTILKEMLRKISSSSEESRKRKDIKIDGDIRSIKKRKLPDEISQGMKLVQSGLKVLGDGFSQWQQNPIYSAETRKKLFTHFSRLEEEIAYLATLAADDD